MIGYTLRYTLDIISMPYYMLMLLYGKIFPPRKRANFWSFGEFRDSRRQRIDPPDWKDRRLLRRAAAAAWTMPYWACPYEVRAATESAGSRGFWETLYVQKARFILAGGAILFEATVSHELYESIDSSMPRQWRTETTYRVAVSIGGNGKLLSCQTSEPRFSDSEIPAHRGSEILWPGVAAKVARHIENVTK